MTGQESEVQIPPVEQRHRPVFTTLIMSELPGDVCLFFCCPSGGFSLHHSRVQPAECW